MNENTKHSGSPSIAIGVNRTEYRHHNSCVAELDIRKRDALGKLIRGYDQ
jgi:hypothetical protein